MERLRIIRLLSGAAVFAAGVPSDGRAELALFTAAYAILGYDVLLYSFKNIVKGRVFDENFLMSAATLGAFAIGEYPEAAAVMLFYQVGEFFQELAVTRSEKSITDLMDLRPDSANLLKNGNITAVNPAEIAVGDTIIIKPGEKIPLDGVVVSGESVVDTSALTGESAPRYAGKGSEVISGCVNLSGVLTVKVNKIFAESTASKILELTRNAAGKKAETENFITAFAKIYTPAVVAAALLVAVIPPLFNGMWGEWVRRALVFLVISCPCALVVSVPLGFFAGIGAASSKGILIKGGNFLEALVNLDIVAFDKTGTLTEGKFKVTGIIPADGFSQNKLLETAAKAEAFSSHPIALSVREAFGGNLSGHEASDYSEKPGRGVGAVADGVHLLAGSAEFLRENGISFEETDTPGAKLYVAADRKFAGCVIMSDEIKKDAKAAVLALKKSGVRKITVITGDNVENAEAVARAVGADEVRATLLPHEKVAAIESLDSQKRPKGKLAFVGDGVNDAPVLARADLGVAMGGLGSDAAIEAADVVLMTDEPMKLAEAIAIARRTRRVVIRNIIFALTAKSVFLVLGVLGIADMREAVFADVGVSLIAVLNSVSLLKRK